MQKGQSDCTPFCPEFVCDQGKGVLLFRKEKGKKVAWCATFEDTCDGGWCQYAKCRIRRMGDAGKCRGRLATKKGEVDERDDFVDPQHIPKKYEKKIRSKGNL